MRITENVLHEACSEINTKFEKLGSPHTIHVRQGQYGSGRIVELHDGKRTTSVTNIDESNRAVFAYLQGMDDAIHNYGKQQKVAKPSGNKVSLKYKASGDIFNALFTRCIDHEFDLSVSLEHVIYLSSDIDHAKSSLDINDYEYGRLLEQYRHTVTTATVQANEDVRPTGNVSKLFN